MKILILTTSDPYKLAGVVALDLYKGLNAIKVNEVKILVKIWGRYKDKNIIPFESFISYQKKRLFRKIRRLFILLKLYRPAYIKNNSDYCVLDHDLTITDYSTEDIIEKCGFVPEVILVLFMQNFISFKNLYELNTVTKAPIFLYMMDMAPITGGCHYAWDCNGYTKECGYCPALYSKEQHDQSNVNYLYKKTYIEKTNIIPIVGSEWQLRQINKSSLFKDKRKFKVLLSVDENKYFPTDKNKVRQELKLPTGKKIIFFGAVTITEKRKGLLLLIDALKILSKRMEDTSKIHLAIAGNNNADFKDVLPFQYTLLGYLNHNDLPKAFQSADVFISPSIEDSGPMMVSQSIMCGTPVVAFEIGVALDLIRTGETGYIAKLKDGNDLANGIKYILELENHEYTNMSSKCRETALNLYHAKKKMNDLMEIFNIERH